MRFLKSIGKRKKVKELTAKETIRLVDQLLEIQIDQEQMSLAEGDYKSSEMHKHRRQALQLYKRELEKKIKSFELEQLANQGKKISA